MLSSTDFTTLRDILSNPRIEPGQELEDVLNQTGIQPNEALVLEIFNQLDSSPKPLFTLFLWTEKQPGFGFSVAVFNAMVNALGMAREFDRAWDLILERLNGNERPNIDSFVIMIRRYARAGMPSPAIRAYEFASTLDFLQDIDSKDSLFEILLDSLCKEGLVRVASNYFNEHRARYPTWVPSIRMYNILLNGWFRSRKLKQAERFWTEMKKDNVKASIVTYGTLVEGYCRMGRVEVAVALISEMKEKGVEPNAIVYNPVIDALGEAGRFKEALEMMERISVLESGPTLSTYNSLVKGYCKAGDIEAASKILKMMINKNFMPTTTTYNYFFRYFSKHGRIDDGLNLYTKLTNSGYVADRLTYQLLVKMLCEKGRLNLSMQLVKEMRAGGCDLDLATCSMLIHLLVKMQHFDLALQEFQDMIRRGLVPQYLTYQKIKTELKLQGKPEMAQKLSNMMASVAHSKNLPHTYVPHGNASHARRESIMRKAEAASGLLKSCNDRGELVKRRNPLENSVSNANRLADAIKKRVQQV